MPKNTKNVGFWKRFVNWVVELDHAMHGFDQLEYQIALRDQAKRLEILERKLQAFKQKDMSDVID